MPFRFLFTLFWVAVAALGAVRAQGQVHTSVLTSNPAQGQRYRQLQMYRTFHQSNLRTAQNVGPINLPFFDDFSTSVGGIADSSRWFNNSGVYVNNTYCYQPPSLNAATFDGIRADGQPYSINTRAAGPCDVLTSLPFNVAGADTHFVYLSFFLQAGNREVESRPDTVDSLIVQARVYPSYANPATPGDTIWQTIFKQKGGIDIAWRSHLVQIPGPLVQDGFQFQFVNYGRQNGAFDVFNVDYINLDKDRFTDDTLIRDIAYQGEPEPLFRSYRAIPLKHYQDSSLNVFSDSATAQLNNFNNTIVNLNAQFEAAPLATPTTAAPSIVSLNTGQQNILGTDRPLDPLANRDITPVQEKLNVARRSITSLGDTPELFGQKLLYRYAITSEPDFNRVETNDTLTGEAILQDYYAYDDGTAEKIFYTTGAQARTVLKYYTYKPDSLAGISIGIDQRTFSVNTNVPLAVTVYKFIKGVAGYGRDSALLVESVALVNPATVQTFNAGYGFANGIYYFPFSRLQPVADTFYVGYRQGVGEENRVYVLADINSKAPNTLFTSTLSDIWDPYTLSTNALMIRPHFKGRPLVATRPLLARPMLRVAPNPAQPGGALRLEGRYATITLTDVQGRSWVLKVNEATEGQTYTTLPATIPPGLYAVTATTVQGNYTMPARLVVE